MSDEEKKAIKILKINPEIIADLDEEMFEKMCEFKEKSIKELKYWASQTVLNLIKKQSKEIEELKEGFKTQEHNYQVAMEEIEQRWKDKIKAKIEEIEEKLEYETNGWESEYEYCKEVLQSLLEKE